MESTSNTQDWVKRAAEVASGIRLRVLDHTVRQNGGYLSQACSSAEIFAALYCRILHTGTIDTPIIPGPFPGTPSSVTPATFGARFNGPAGPEYDRFILSPAQYALVLYAALIETGRMDESGMRTYNQDGSTVEMIGAEHSPGMEVTTGSLGQGISQAAGIAFARKRRNDSGRVVMFMSDGECQSGQFWEAVQAASWHKLDNILVYVDMNGYQCDGKMTTVMNLEPFDDRLRAFGANVHRIGGHDLELLDQKSRQVEPGKPTFVLCDTCPWQGLPLLETRYPKFHYVRFKSPDEREQYRQYYESIASGNYTENT